MAINISKVTDRNELPVRHAPYWQRVERRCYIGFRRKSKTTAGVWLARYWDAEASKLVERSLGEFANVVAADRFDAAKAAASEWFDRVGAGGDVDIRTVADACRAYITKVRNEGKRANAAKVADEIDARFQRLVYPDPIAKLALSRLRESHVKAWRERLEAKPAFATRTKTDRKTKARAASTVNRDITPLRAALNNAREAGAIASDRPWVQALKPIEGADGRREEYLSREERKSLIEKSDDEIKPFLTALALLPLRPGALSMLTRADYDERNKVLRVSGDKGHKPRDIKLPPSAAALFDELAKSRLPAAPLLRRHGGEAWNKDSWKAPVKAAALAAELSAKVSAYTLRHSTITDLVNDTDLPLLAVAQISGTSVAMIEKHYSKLRQDRAAAALSTLAI